VQTKLPTKPAIVLHKLNSSSLPGYIPKKNYWVNWPMAMLYYVRRHEAKRIQFAVSLTNNSLTAMQYSFTDSKFFEFDFCFFMSRRFLVIDASDSLYACELFAIDSSGLFITLWLMSKRPLSGSSKHMTLIARITKPTRA
jgi:hypothetical protein